VPGGLRQEGALRRAFRDEENPTWCLIAFSGGCDGVNAAAPVTWWSHEVRLSRKMFASTAATVDRPSNQVHGQLSMLTGSEPVECDCRGRTEETEFAREDLFWQQEQLQK
jgi:hypothetical protein